MTNIRRLMEMDKRRRMNLGWAPSDEKYLVNLAIELERARLGLSTECDPGERPDLHSYMMAIAKVASSRGTCPRRAVGAVLVKNGHVVSTGYNGSPPGLPHCSDVGCLTDGVTPNCHRTIHAEANALLHSEARGDTLYCTDQPCLSCTKLALTHGVKLIVYGRPYPDEHRDLFLRDSGLGGLMLYFAGGGEE